MEPVPAGSRTTKQVLIGPEEGPNFALRKFTMEPGGGMAGWDKCPSLAHYGGMVVERAVEPR